MRGTNLLACFCSVALFACVAVALGACGASNQPANDQTTVTVTPPGDSAASAPPSAPAPAPAASH